MAESLSGKLLVASPAMSDYFRRSVVLVVEHNDDGAFGLVLNKPSDSTVGEAAPELGETLGSEHVLHIGGPVQPNAVTAIGDHPEPAEATKIVVGAVGMVDLDHPPQLDDLRVFAGYTGWSAGQLDGEVEAEAWIIDPARPADVFADGDLWSEVLERMGDEFALLARMPSDPSMN